VSAGGATATFRFVVSGRVQGVGYRYFALRAAEALGVTGFVRNLADGRVEAVGEGPEEVLAEFEQQLRQGPAFSHVESVERAAIEPRGDRGFQVR
jgi:acylphosphatase